MLNRLRKRRGKDIQAGQSSFEVLFPCSWGFRERPEEDESGQDCRDSDEEEKEKAWEVGEGYFAKSWVGIVVFGRRID